MRNVFLLFIFYSFLPQTGYADVPSKPIVRTEFTETTAIPGQPLTLRITVLVPTWMPQPPVFPSFEVPNVLVRLPSRASTSVSERVDGETWSGVSRAYRLYPMTGGRFVIPAQPISLTYADPDTRAPIPFSLETEEVRFSGLIPDNARDVVPFIAAESLTLEQIIDGTPDTLSPGDAVIRKVIAKVGGVSPMFLPSILTVPEQEGLSVYAREPVLSESDNRGVLSGTREETLTYVPSHGGRFRAPPVTIKWYNLKTGEVEQTSLDGFELTVRGEVPPPASKRDDIRNIVFQAFGVLLGLSTLIRLGVHFYPDWRERLDAAREKWHASEDYAFKTVLRAVSAQDLDRALKALALWDNRSGHIPAQQQSQAVEVSLARIGQSLYGKASKKVSDDAWRELKEHLQVLRKRRLKTDAGHRSRSDLPPLNPGNSA